MEVINIFTDGSTLNNQKKGNRIGGSGVFFGDNDDRNLMLPLKETKLLKVTNQVAELTACVKAVEIISSTEKIDNKNVIIYTDSMYIVNSITKWAKNWEKKNWTKSNGKVIENLELMKTLYQLSLKFKINFKHVKAHKAEPHKNSKDYYLWYGNFMADKLAVAAANTLLS